MVGCPATDLNVVDSNPSCVELGHHGFNNPHIGHKYGYTREEIIKSDLAKL